MDAVEGYILVYKDGPRVGHRIGHVLYGTEGAAKSARTNMFSGGYVSSDYELPLKERRVVQRARAETRADIVPLYRRIA